MGAAAEAAGTAGGVSTEQGPAGEQDAEDEDQDDA